MKLVNAKYNLIVDMKENIADVIVVEQPQALTDIVGGLYYQCSGNVGDFVLSVDEKEEKLEKNCSIIINPFDVEFNDRKILNRLYTKLTEYGNDHFEQKEKLNGDIINLLDQIVFESPYKEVSFNLELDWNSIFKMYDVKINENTKTLLEKFIEYINILVDLCNIRILCIVNLKNYMSKDDIEQLYKAAGYKKMQLLLIETIDNKYANENTYIIDKDMCLIANTDVL